MLCALIMAGGEGTRFWPSSTEKKPKQFINIIGNKTMIQLTIERINKLISIERIFVSTCEGYKKLVMKQLPGLPEENIIVEPVGKNTAPSILLASLYIKKKYEESNIIVLPSDHLIGNIDKFLNNINIANKFIKDNNKAIITFGIKPNRPETNYGYISVDTIKENNIIKVNRFLEKPTLDTAKKIIKEKKCLWNAGIFIFNIEAMIKEFEINLNYTYKLLYELENLDKENYKLELYEKYSKCENISIDYAIMEKSKNIYTIPSDFDWDDIGNWSAIKRYMSSDSNNNYIKGNGVMCNASNNIVFSQNKKIIMLDVSDLFCIETEEIILIGPQEKIKDIKEYRKRYNL